MKLRYNAPTAFLVLNLLAALTYAQLSVQDPLWFGTKPGYIDNATIVLEPRGAFVEQTLILDYADHLQYPGHQNLEIVQKFTLPEGAVVHNLWLLIGDSLVEAQMFSTWTARHIYDSIVVRRRDPAFLSKNGNNYELHIYPLVSGKTRRTKINFITPTQWIGNAGFVELPFVLLSGNNAEKKPVTILFREKDNSWGTASIRELPQLAYRQTVDSSGHRFDEFDIPDISSLTGLSVQFAAEFNNGLYTAAERTAGDTSYFQIGVDPAAFNVTRSDTGAMSAIVGIDLSGNSNNDVSSLVPRVSSVLRQALRPIDRFRLVVASGGSVPTASGWKMADTATIDTVLSNFVTSAAASESSGVRRPTIIFCDEHSQEIWRFPALNTLANIIAFNNITIASHNFGKSDIVASYDHGMESAAQTNDSLSVILPSMDSLFSRGGRFLGYFDHNRPGRDRIETHYINGLTEENVAYSQTLYANPDGNIGIYFPPSITLNNVNYLTFNDPDVKVEMANSNGDAAVISKRIGKGLLVVSGIWSFVDDGASKQTLAIPLLGVSSISQGQRPLTSLLDSVRSLLSRDQVKEVFIFSNADSLISKAYASGWVDGYVTGLGSEKPVFNTINLLDGGMYVPPYVSEGGTDFYGSGYLEYRLSEATGGVHFETHLKSWDFIAGTLAYSKLAAMESLNISVGADDGSGGAYDLSEVNPERSDPARPRFFIGSSSATTKLGFKVQAVFRAPAQILEKTATAYVTMDTTRKTPLAAQMLGWEKLKDLFLDSTPDTSAILNLALKYKLLCDYTALIALEPKTQTPGSNTDNPGNLISVTEPPRKYSPDTLIFRAYPNPFNPQTTFYLSLRRPSTITIIVYNVLGQVVRTLALSAGSGTATILWDGRDYRGSTVATGVYFARAIIVEKSTGVISQRTLKLLMLK